jgi:DNA oxidative demethylase
MPGRMRGTVERPGGLRYVADFLDLTEERDLLGWLAGIAYDPVVMHETVARRGVKHFGYRYGYESWGVAAAEPFPPLLVALRDRCAELAGVAADAFAEALATRYPQGATIGWHRDAPTFGSVVVGVSVGSPCLLRFQRRVAGERRVYELAVAPRSA